MSDNPDKNGNDQVEAAVGFFETQQAAEQAAKELRKQKLAVQCVSRQNAGAADDMPNIAFEDIDEVDSDHVLSGMVQGGAIGAGSGLLMFAVPGLNIAAPIAGALAGAFIGGVAGIDEADRVAELPDFADYQKRLAAGESFLVIAGSESERIQYGNLMKELGAREVYQHPPVKHMVPKPGEE